ncbi:MAG: branched-chain amino acid ABC transporter, partial [Alphaproteobacteria bacterium]|nr:branched-chain amino acid ABC transporter [Alphaproteobacteria bacterium]
MLDLSTLRAAETMALDIRHPTTGDLTGWIWIIAGPGHPSTVAYQEKMQRRRLNEEKLKEQARINGRKWKGDDRDPDEVHRDNVEAVAVRVVDF